LIFQAGRPRQAGAIPKKCGAVNNLWTDCGKPVEKRDRKREKAGGYCGKRLIKGAILLWKNQKRAISPASLECLKIFLARPA